MNGVNFVLMFLCFIFLGPLVIEVAGYFWHRYVEHEGMAGKAVMQKHIQHHEVDYPTSELRPDTTKYKNAKSWSWYVLTVILIVSALIILPRPYSFFTILGGLVYAKFAVQYFHRAFHLPHHWLQNYTWFRNLTHLHDIHHYENANYGIVLFFMDRVFGTYTKEVPAKKKIVFRHLEA